MGTFKLLERLYAVVENIDTFLYLVLYFFLQDFKLLPKNSNILQLLHISPKAKDLILQCLSIQWKKVSPIVLGSVYQLTLDKSKRRRFGIYYTNETNVLYVLHPLFLSALKEELKSILVKPSVETLLCFHTKITSLTFLDPACGCGNFLVVTYKELRLLEYRILKALYKLGYTDKLKQRISLQQFYGIELLKLPAKLAAISLYFAQYSIDSHIEHYLSYLPDNARFSNNILCANALTTEWKSVIPHKIDYIFGNPPFCGSRHLTYTQRQEMQYVFNNIKHYGSLDYVTAWFKKTSRFIHNTESETAFVASDSICQGQSAPVFYKSLLQDRICINFAYKSFAWDNASTNCIILGFSKIDRVNKYIFEITEGGGGKVIL